MIQPTARYNVIKKYILDNIENSLYAINDQIPSERELIELFGVSRITVSKAINDLVNEGVLYRVQGKGTFVKKDNLKKDLFSLVSCTQDIENHGMEATKKLLEQKVIASLDYLCHSLNVDTNDELLEISRVYYADSDPINYTVSYIPCRRFKDIEKIDFATNSLYSTLETKYDVKITKATRQIEAVSVPKEIGEHLDMEENAPVLLFKATTYGVLNGEETPIEVFKCYYRSDKFKFYINQIK